MIRHCLVFLFVTLFTFKLVISQENLETFPTCWPDEFTYKKFDVLIYFSSRNKTLQLIQNNSKSMLTTTDFDPRRRTAVIVHGFMSNSQKYNIRNLANQLLAWKDINVLTVDWSAGCSTLLQYDQAAINTEYAAMQIKDVFKKLKENWIESGESLDDWGPLHFIGFSLGAHVVGQAAEFLRIEENLLVDRVTGLDPAEPCFEDTDITIRLSKKNARFVDVIHTDGASSRNNAFGLLDAIGHADFYVNGGSIQPGCIRGKKRGKRYLLYQFAISVIVHYISNGICNHARAVQVFTDSLVQATSNQCKYWAHPWSLNSSEAETSRILNKTCDASMCPEMGINAELYEYQNSESNMYYVVTTGNAPYCATST